MIIFYYSSFPNLNLASSLILLTKADKPNEAALAATLETKQTALVKRPAAHPEMIATSAVKGHGINLLQAEIAGLVDLSAIGYKP